MPKERAHLSFDDDLDISGFEPKKTKDRIKPDPRTLETIAEQSGFTSRNLKRRRIHKRSPYQTQLNLKCREPIKPLFHELGKRLDTYDYMTFELALLALIEKHNYVDLKAIFEETTKKN